MIKIDRIRKEYRIPKRENGAFKALWNLFSRDYKTVHAVDGISLNIAKGESLGFIGPNGAGKSTLIKMLTGILHPTSGEIIVNGVVPYKQRVANAWHIGVVFGQRTQLWWDLPAYESFMLLKHIYKIPDNMFNENLDLFKDLLDLDSFIDTPVRQLSLGQRMRADLAATFLHAPPIVYLDEPTLGLDVIAKHRIREFLIHLNEVKGTTIFFTTHDMQDIEKICKRIVIIDHGKIIYDGTIERIKKKYGHERILVVDFKQDYDLLNLDIADAKIVRSENQRMWISFRREETTAANLISQIASKYEINDLTIQEPDIDTIIRKIYNSESSH